MTERAFDDDGALRPPRSAPRVERSLRAAGLVSAAVVLALMTAVASGHHSFAMYDTKVTRTLTGRLVQFVPGANHAQLIFELLEPDGEVSVDARGEPVLWGVETGPAARIARRGVTLDQFAVGTVITVNLNPLRDGRNFGALARDGGRLIHCGTRLPVTGCTAETGTIYLGDE